MQLVDAGSCEKRRLVHVLQTAVEFAPGVVLKVPAGQAMQKSDDVAPCELLYRATGQAMHRSGVELVGVVLKRPASQLMQRVLSCSASL